MSPRCPVVDLNAVGQTNVKTCFCPKISIMTTVYFVALPNPALVLFEFLTYERVDRVATS